MSDAARDPLIRGIAAAKAGDRTEARHSLEWALRQQPSSDEQLEALLVPYDPAYLAAWPAETYSLSLTNAALRARGHAGARCARLRGNSPRRPGACG